MDKDLSRRLFRVAGVPTADWLMAPVDVAQVAASLGWPMIVKPNKQGSTVGLSVVRHALQLDDAVLIERFVPGREFTVGQIIAPGEVFDYQSKYQTDGARLAR